MGLAMELRNDTILNVAQLMKADVGASRTLTLDLDRLELDEDLYAKDVHGDLRLTRITSGILAQGKIRGTAVVECVRCLELYDQPYLAEFDEEYRPTIDVRSGLLLDQPDPEEEIGRIDEAHELDLSEPLRQVSILALPIKPICRDDCASIVSESLDADATGDRRFGVLSQLLGPDDETIDETTE